MKFALLEKAKIAIGFAPKPDSEPARKPNAVLIVDDNPNTAAIISTAALAFGLRPIIATSGESAVTLIRNNGPISLALIDVVLSGISGQSSINGWQVRQEVEARKPATRICMMSAYPKSFESMPPGKPITCYLKGEYSYAEIFRKLCPKPETT